MTLQDMIEKLLGRIKPGKDGHSAQVQRMAESWPQTVIAGMTPARMAAVLKRAAEAGATSRPGEDIGSELEDFFTLADEMEEIDPHYRSVLGTRKLSITGLEPEVSPAHDDAAEDETVEFVRKMVEAPAFADLIIDLLDGLGKGYSVVQPVWQVEDGKWVPQEYVWQDQRAFMWDRHERRVSLRPEDASGTLKPMQPGHAIVHVPKLKSGNPVRGSLARVVAWSFLYKNYTIKDWMRFLEVYGMPIRVGKYGTNATEDDKRSLIRALTRIGSDAAAAIPQGMEIEFVQASSGSSASGPVFGHMAEYIDKQMSKAVLGQTMTADDGSSRAQAEVHDDVRDDIKRADARQLEATITRDLITPAVVWNFGANAQIPRFRLPVPEPEDLKLWTESVTSFMGQGLEVSKRQVREKFGLDEPDDEEDALKGRTPPDPEAQDAETNEDGDQETPDDDPRNKLEASQQPHYPGCPCCRKANLADSSPVAPADDTDSLIANALAGAGDDMDGMIGPLLKAAAEATDFDDFTARLSSVAGEMDAGAIIARLGPLTAIARGLGDARDEP